MLEIVYNSDESSSDSSSDNISSSDNEIYNITVAVTDAIINDDSGDEEEILHQFQLGDYGNYTG